MGDAAVQRDLDYLGPDPADWVPPRAGITHNVVIIGAGQTGLAVAFALRRAGIGGVSLLDAAAEGEESIWRHRARMLTLRTPKTNLGPDLGIPALTFQAWYEARHGAQAFAALTRPLTADWADYLHWYRQFLRIPVRWRTRLVDIAPAGDALALSIEQPDGTVRREVTRKLVLATGLGGTGAPFVPALLREALSPALYAHSIDRIDFAALAGKRVAVLGAAASAFDQAATALEAGAASVHLFSRRTEINPTFSFRAAAYPGAEYFYLLPDAERWRLGRHYLARASNPPADSVARAVRHPNFHIHLNAPWTGLTESDGRAVVRSRGEDFAFDFIIAATGFSNDPADRPELAGIADNIALWGDRYTPPEAEADDTLARLPYLGPAYQFSEKTPGTAPFLANIHAFNNGAFLSFAKILGDIGSLKVAVPRLVTAIAGDLFAADPVAQAARLAGPTVDDFAVADYAAAIWPNRAGTPLAAVAE